MSFAIFKSSIVASYIYIDIYGVCCCKCAIQYSEAYVYNDFEEFSQSIRNSRIIYTMSFSIIEITIIAVLAEKGLGIYKLIYIYIGTLYI